MARTTKVVLLLVVTAALLTAETANGQSVPARYRYTGWVSQVHARLPQHMIVVAGPFKLLFNDFANPSGSEAYRVCYLKLGATPHCANRTLSGVHVDAISTAVYQTGRYVARWSIAGHVVASSVFLVVQGD